MGFKIEELHDLKIVFKSGAFIVTKRVIDYNFSSTSYNIKWHNKKNHNIVRIDPSEIVAIVCVKKHKVILWK